MLHVELTEHFTGFRIHGDYDALDKLYDTVWTLADVAAPGDEPKPDESMRARLLALCYDLRHAYQGDRGVTTRPSGMDAEKASWLGIDYAPRNQIFSVEVLYPEAMYEFLVLDHLVELRRKKILGSKARLTSPYAQCKALYDQLITHTRYYQGLMVDALRPHVSSQMLTRVLQQAAAPYSNVSAMYTQWVDVINMDWMAMTQKKRAKGFSTVVRDLADYSLHEQYREMRADIDASAKENGTHVDNVRLNLEYPEDIEW